MNIAPNGKYIVDEEMFIETVKNIIKRDYFQSSTGETPNLSLNEYLSKYTTEDDESFRKISFKELSLFAQQNQMEFDPISRQIICPNQLFFPASSLRKVQTKNQDQLKYKKTELLVDSLQINETNEKLHKIENIRHSLKLSQEKKPKKTVSKKSSFL
ncbi:transcription regulator [Entamoeba histolytica]|uniref:Transcription regulator n=1 Tax=Entamoeba histolytica TaxID=5759 RepID=A0A175JIS8_ENTHI|nr:transcription regulator [Entamoeba histolytica]